MHVVLWVCVLGSCFESVLERGVLVLVVLALVDV